MSDLQHLREIASERRAGYVKLDRSELRDLLATIDALRATASCPAEQLPADSPVNPARLAEIRAAHEAAIARWQRINPALSRDEICLTYLREGDDDRHDLLGLYEHERDLRKWCETLLSDSCKDDNRYEMGVQAGVAKASAALNNAIKVQRVAKAADSGLGAAEQHGYLDGLVGAAIVIQMCHTDAQAPPHEQSLARLRKCEEALYAISTLDGSGDGGIPRAVAIACEALEEGGTS